jgi:hypothetical protein
MSADNLRASDAMVNAAGLPRDDASSCCERGRHIRLSGTVSVIALHRSAINRNVSAIDRQSPAVPADFPPLFGSGPWQQPSTRLVSSAHAQSAE